MLILCCLSPVPSESVGRGGMVARSRTRAPTTSRVTPWPFSFRGAFWRLSLGSEGALDLPKDLPKHLPNRGRSVPIFLAYCLT